MAYNKRWRRAVMVSVFCHIFLFAGAGYLSAQLLTMPVAQEQYVELELMNESEADSSIASTSNEPSPPIPDILQPTPAAEKIKSEYSSIPVAVKDTPSVVTTGDLADASASSNETSAASTQPASTGSTNSTTNNAVSSGKPSGIIAPRILSKVSPSYPEVARRAGIEGTVVLKIQIFENGRADNISIARSSGNEELDDVAIATIRQWQFVPAKNRDSGQAIACYTTIPISFRLKE